MKVVSNIIATAIVYTVVGTSLALGAKIAETVYENGLGEKVTKASKKLFQSK